MARVVKKRRVASQSYGDVADLKRSLKRKGGGASGKIGYIPEDPITVRFLSEPETWVGYYEHYNGPDADPRYSPCTKGECDVNPYQGKKPAFRFIANAYIADTGKVQALKMPKMLVDTLVEFYSKNATIMDRDYELRRRGSGLDTTYSAMPEDKSPVKVSRFRKDMVDLEQLLEDWANEQDAADDDDDDDEPIVKKRGRSVRQERSTFHGDGDDFEDDELCDECGGDPDECDCDDEDDVPVVKKRQSSGFTPKRRPVSTKGVEDAPSTRKRVVAKKTVAKKTVAKRAVVRKTAEPAPKRTIRRTK